MAKAGSETTTAWIRYSQAKALSGEHLGDVTYAERKICKGLEAGEISWRCVDFDPPEGYSGPGRGDPNFWREPDNLITSEPGILIAQLGWLTIKGDTARHINGATAYVIELDRSALVRLGLLPSSDVAGDRSSARKKRRPPQQDRMDPVLRKLYPPDGVVPKVIPTETVRGQVDDELADENARLGLRSPGWDAVNRKLGREKPKAKPK
jgi:hypothetical protein